jgi:hypothetical protein
MNPVLERFDRRLRKADLRKGGRNGTGHDGGVGGEDQRDIDVIAELAERSPYPVRPVHPTVSVVLRVGLWAAVSVGATGGVVGLLGVGRGDGEAEGSAPVEDPALVPGQVAGMAELVVGEWLVATEDAEAQIEPLFVEAPTLPSEAAVGDRLVERVTAVGGERVSDGYWAVTVAVDLLDVTPEGVEPAPTEGAASTDEAPTDEVPTDEVPAEETPTGEVPIDGASADEALADGAGTGELPPGDDSGLAESLAPAEGGFPGSGSPAGDAAVAGEDSVRDGEGSGSTPDAHRTRWFVEVGIVGEPGGSLVALRTPAVVPMASEVAEGWSSRAEEAVEVGPDDPETRTIEDFLRTVLVGRGDPTRYVAEGVEIAAADPLPFSGLQVQSLTVEDLGRRVIRAQAYVEATTQAGATQFAAYEVVAKWRGGRLEVLELWGAASLAERPGDGGDDD